MPQLPVLDDLAKDALRSLMDSVGEGHPAALPLYWCSIRFGQVFGRRDILLLSKNALDIA